ncbi:DUF523 domain-containing protein [Roseicyclus mahoneyensis]|uniref:Uncharacterized protein YbbK (DUF523 family) n=1 Tax=Roseicyclus mahoneyensis TaxID=164332 RepID=A0A316G4N3_9RHOB|nr:DUF523 domain-containing protein [Roseicyclus mahoneyensis]PWK55881.1 uncharacterized protein YbbK (DUF523 family) [Roseicyclus mahoneyensis]
MERILVSACLVGAPVRYDGRAKDAGSALLRLWADEGRLMPLCPELAGGFAVPRAPAEITPGATGASVLEGTAHVHDRSGKDVTKGFLDGATAALRLVRDTGCRLALLTEGSPSCGVARIHAGRFDGVTRPGEGVVTAALRQAGVRVFSHEEIADLAAVIACRENRPG